MKKVYSITDEFESQLVQYTGAKYAVALDNMSNGLFLALYYEHHIMNRIKIIRLLYLLEPTHQYLVKLFMLV
jgi:hypothetical protein